jgi:hypothetical protein
MYASVHLERKVKNQKPLNRAQRILRKNRESFPKWYWRILEDRNFETITLYTWDIPKAEVTIDDEGHVTFIALTAIPDDASLVPITLQEV